LWLIATALAVHNGEGVFSTDPDPEHITGRLSLTLMRETLRLGRLPVPAALLDVAAAPTATATAPTLVYISPSIRQVHQRRCHACGRQFNERSGGILNRAQYPSDVIALVIFWWLRYKLSLIGGIEFSYEAVRDWEAKLTPTLIDNLRWRRKGRIGKSWYVDETYI
jgi:hypothetical protein